jgi:hypothetical protein
MSPATICLGCRVMPEGHHSKTCGPVWDLAPAAEIRRRGEVRARHRRLTFAAGALALAALGSAPVAAGLHAANETSVAHESTQVLEVDDGVDDAAQRVVGAASLELGIQPATLQMGREDDARSHLATCDGSSLMDFGRGRAAQTTAASGMNEEGRLERRALAVFSSEDAALAALRTLTTTARQCAADAEFKDHTLALQVDAELSRWSYLSLVRADGSLMGGLNELSFVRVGRAILVVQSDGMVADAIPGQGTVSTSVLNIVSGMCIYTRGGCQS